MVTVKELLMALPNRERFTIWEMLNKAREDITAYDDTIDIDLIRNQYDAIIKEVESHMK